MQNRWRRNDEGSGGAMTKAEPAATMRHNSGKGQQGNRMHDDFNGQHDDDKGQQGNRRRDDEGRTGSATMRGAAARR